jgi:hypothetical protein
LQTQTLLDTQLRLDVPATRAAVQLMRAIDPVHCAECAVFVEAIRRADVIRPLVELLRAVGSDPLRPDELWGAADGHFLNGEWTIVGEFVEGALRNAPQELSPGLSVGFAPQTALLDAPFVGKRVIALQFEWVSPVIAQIARELGVHPGDTPTT